MKLARVSDFSIGVLSKDVDTHQVGFQLESLEQLIFPKLVLSG